jgi:hypothetical protein
MIVKVDEEMLRQMLINELEKDWGRSSELSLLAGYANGSSLKKVLKREDGDIEKFDGFVKLVHELFPDTKFDLMTKFAHTLNKQKLTARFMLEYAALYNLPELKLYLIEELRNSSNKESNDYAFVYGIDDKLRKNEIDKYEAINQLAQHRYVSVEMKVFSKIVQFYSFYDMRNINMMTCLYSDIKVEIESIKKQFVKDSFHARLLLIECGINLHNKNISELRENLFFIDGAFDPIKCLAYLHIGNSYMLTSHDKADDCFLKAYEISNESYKSEIRKSMNFNHILWDRLDKYLPDGDEKNLLFYYAKKGEKANGIKLLNEMDLDSFSDHARAFNYYYQGLLFNDKVMFYKSVEYFNKCGEKFYKKLPILELQKAGESQYILDALIA